jgi:hypothetical protein
MSKQEKRLSREELERYTYGQTLEGSIIMGEEGTLIRLNLRVICSEDSRLERLFKHLVERKRLVFNFVEGSVETLGTCTMPGQMGWSALFDLEGQEVLFSTVNSTESSKKDQ